MWAKQALEMWPTDKTGLVREVCKHLNSEALDFVMILDAPSAAAMCCGLVLGPPAGDEEASAMMKQWGQRRATFIATSPSPSAGVSQVSPGGKEMEIMIIVMGVNDGRAALLAHAAAKIMQRQDGEKIRFEKPIIITAQTVLKDIKMLQETCGVDTQPT